MELNNRLRIALQKSGRLSKKCIELFKKCGLTIESGKRELLSRVTELPIDILYVRDDDITNFVADGICDFGIVGENVFEETSLCLENVRDIEKVIKLGFSKCRLSIAVPGNMKYNTLSDLVDLRIATTYPAILKQYLGQNKISAEVVKMEGSVEVAPHLKIADLICDIVSSGATLDANGLVEKDIILKSQAVLIGKTDIKNKIKREVATKLFARISAVQEAEKSKYVMLNVAKVNLEKVTKLLPGAESPTIVPLANSEKLAVHAVCSEPIFWDTMEALKQAGAQSILVVPIEKMLG